MSQEYKVKEQRCHRKEEIEIPETAEGISIDRETQGLKTTYIVTYLIPVYPIDENG